MKVMVFCIPAFGHVNPTLEVVRELVRRGHDVRYYSFSIFREKIESTGATFVCCDEFLPSPGRGGFSRLKFSATEQTLQAIDITANIDATLTRDFEEFKPDLIFSDAVTFWGKLAAVKHSVPIVLSSATFAFNRYSSRYMENSPRELWDYIGGLPRVSWNLRKLRKYGYKVKSALSLVAALPDADTILYTTEKFHPCVETFDKKHYKFVGPSVVKTERKVDPNARPLVYISLGTVVNERPDFYKTCVEALKDVDFDVVVSCGTEFDPKTLENVPSHIRIEQSVNQMEVLSRASLFLTHCGMNSASEGLYMGVPELLFPQTNEQRAVARRVAEVGAGRRLTEAEASDATRLRKAIVAALADESIKSGALAMSEDFRNSPGVSAAVDFLESKSLRANRTAP